MAYFFGNCNMQLEVVHSIKELLSKAGEAEPQQAIDYYQQVIKQDHLNEFAYDRLMILYRKLQDYKNEISTINLGIKAFEKYYKSRQTKSKKVIELSQKLNKSVGLTDKKGNMTYEPEPIAKWRNRMGIAEKKLKKQLAKG